MLAFNFNNCCYPLIFALIFVQDSIIAVYSQPYRNFQCVTFHLYDTSTVKIIFKDVPKNYKNLGLQHKALKYDSTFQIFHPNNIYNESYYQFNNVVVKPSHASLLTVQFYIEEIMKRKTVIKYILENNRNVPVHNCSNYCTIEFNDWSVPSEKSAIIKFINEEKAASSNRNRTYVEGYQRIEFQQLDVANIEIVYITNLPPGTHFVDLFFDNGNEISKNEIVLEHNMCIFKQFNFTLFNNYDGTAISIKLKDQNERVLETRQIAIFIEIPNRNGSRITKKHACLNKCIIEYDYNEEMDTAHNAVCPKVETPKPTEPIKHYGGKSTKQPYLTTVTAIPNTKVETDTVPDSDNKLAIILPCVSIGLLISGIVLYIMYKRKKPNNQNDNTYLYVTANQLNYADLDLQSSELYEVPKKSDVSAYTRIIGTLIPK